MKFFFPIVLVALFFIPVINSYAAIPQKEREALIALYESTDGENWTHHIGWKTPPLDSDGFALPGTECGWDGVMCSDGILFQLSLANCQLNGRIPTELGNLTNLTNLLLDSNQLTGSIPVELGNLNKLEFLNLSTNQLTGNIQLS